MCIVRHEKLIVCKGQAGLGNRILCLLTCFLYAELSDRKVFVDWRDNAYSGNNVNIFPYLFKSDMVVESDLSDYNASVNPLIWKENMHLSVLDLCRQENIKSSKINASFIYHAYSASLGKIDYFEDIIIFSSYAHKLPKLRKFFVGKHAEYARLKSPDLLRLLIEKHLSLSDEVADSVNMFQDTCFKRPVIGVHIRHTDRTTPIKKIHAVINRFMKSNSNMQIFLACDNKKVQEDFKHKYQNVTTTEKWLPGPGERLHNNPNKPNNVKMAREAVIDMYLLSKCDYLVYPGRSTFSVISHLLSGLPSDKVFNIDKWNFKEKLKERTLPHI